MSRLLVVLSGIYLKIVPAPVTLGEPRSVSRSVTAVAHPQLPHPTAQRRPHRRPLVSRSPTPLSVQPSPPFPGPMVEKSRPTDRRTPWTPCWGPLRGHRFGSTSPPSRLERVPGSFHTRSMSRAGGSWGFRRRGQRPPPPLEPSDPKGSRARARDQRPPAGCTSNIPRASLALNPSPVAASPNARTVAGSSFRPIV